MMKFGLLLLLTVAATKAAEGPLFNDILKNVASRRTVLEKRQSDWTSVTRDVKIAYNLEEHPLQIMTNSTVGSGENASLELFTAEEEFIGAIVLWFSDTAQYRIGRCTSSWSTFPVDLPASQNKIWTFTKTATALKIECNGVEVVNYLYSDSSNVRCVTKYSMDAEKIMFPSARDTASDKYRQKPTDDVTPTNGTDSEHELVWAGMFTLGDDGRLTRTNNGLVIISLVNTRTGEEHVGTVCDDGFSDASADIGCKLLGYDYAYSWENHRDYQHIPASMIEEYEIGIVADEFRCPEGAETLDDCSYNLLTHDCSHQEDIVLNCAGEDPFTEFTRPYTYPTDYTTDGPTWGPTASDLDDEIAVKFGGLEVKLKVNPKKGRAKVADILEEIAYFLG